MGKWKVVYKNRTTGSYIEISPVFYPKNERRIKRKTKRKRYSTLEKLLFLYKTRNVKDYK